MASRPMSDGIWGVRGSTLGACVPVHVFVGRLERESAREDSIAEYLELDLDGDDGGKDDSRRLGSPDGTVIYMESKLRAIGSVSNGA
jgi:hypothetical protein